MLKNWRILTLIAVLTLLLGACSPAPEAPAPTDPPVTEEEPQPDMEDEEEVIVEEEEPAPAIDAAAIYAARCARCHSADRSGNNGPALLPERLTKDPAAYEATLVNGSGPMPAFGNSLSAEEISALVDFILSEPE